MPSVQRLITSKELAGYTPAIDPRRQGTEGIISGQNFMNGLDGPFSSFASNIAVYRHCDATSRVKFTSYISPKGTIYYGTPTGVYTIDPITRVYTQILGVNVSTTYWPWSFAFVGNFLYMAQKDIGLFRWDENNNEIRQIAVLNNGLVRSICEAYGRLIYLTDQVVGYSALDDGTNQTPSTVTGAGFQPISLIGGTPYHVGRVATGFVVATSNGLMLGAYVTAAYVFAFQAVFRTVKIFSPNAVCEIPDQGLAYLDAQGIWLFNGQEPAALDEVMSQFLKDNFLQVMNQTKYGALQLSYSAPTRKLYAQFAPNAREGQFTSTLVFDVVTKNWGSCDRTHFGIVDYVDPNTNVFRAAFMGLDGFLRYFLEQNYVEVAPASVADFRFTVNADTPAYTAVDLAGDKVYVFPCNINLVDPVLGYFYTVARPLTITGMYQTNETVLSDTVPSDADRLPDTTGAVWVFYSTFSLFQSGMVYYYPTAYAPPQDGLNSVLTLGPYRFEQQFIGAASADETSQLTGIIVGVSSTLGMEVFDDWETYDDKDDWLADGDSVEDFGLAVVNANNFTLDLNDTEDGLNPPFFGTERLDVVSNLNASLQYSPAGNSSIFHNLTFTAAEAQEYFSIKFIDMGGALTGRRV